MKLSGKKRPGSRPLENIFSAAFFKPGHELLPLEFQKKVDISIEEHWVESGKYSLNGWYLSAPNPEKTVVFFHGSTGSNYSWLLLFHYLLSRNLSVWSFDYAGFGKSTGTTSFSNFFYDIEKIFQYILKMEESSLNQIILFGHSLGCFAIDHLLKNFDAPSQVILQSPVFSLTHLLKGKMPAFLSNYLRISQFSLSDIYNSKQSLSILYGTADNLFSGPFGKDFWEKRKNTMLIEFPEYKHASFVNPKILLLDQLFK